MSEDSATETTPKPKRGKKQQAATETPTATTGLALSVEQPDLARALGHARRAVAEKTSMPVLSCVLLEAKGGALGGSLTVSATDLAVSVRAGCSASVDSAGSVAVSAKQLCKLIERLTGTIRLTVDPSNVLTVRAGRSTYEIPGGPASDFPTLPSPENLDDSLLPVAALAELVDRVAPSVSEDETRPHMSGVLFERERTTLRLVSTDGHRLTLAARQFSGLSDATDKAGRLVPGRGVDELRRLLTSCGGGDEEVAVGFDRTCAHVRVREGKPDAVALSAGLTNAAFPPYEQVIPKNNRRSFTFDRDEMVESLQRIVLTAMERSLEVRLVFSPGKVTLRSENPERGRGSEELDAEHDLPDGFVLGFNARYLVDAFGLAPTDDNLTVWVGGELDPALVRVDDEAYVCVVMPLRI